jgi:RNA polymerase sigma factor (sigma-70 family)
MAASRGSGHRIRLTGRLLHVHGDRRSARPGYTSFPSRVCVLDDGDGVVGDGMNEAETEYAWLFATEFRPVARTVFLIVHDRGRAEDITQDAFVELLQRWRKISRYDRPGAWVRRIAVRMAIREVRREGRRPALELEAAPPAGPEPPDEDLRRAILGLPPMQRAVVVLFYFEDRPTAELADILGCSDATVRVHLSRARKRLAEILGEELEVVDDVP